MITIIERYQDEGRIETRITSVSDREAVEIGRKTR